MKYQPALDGLRAAAIIAVVTFHAYRSFCPGGWAGVDVFFVLSGYLISKILLTEITRTGTINLKYFYLRRILRLCPALACLVVLLSPVMFFDHTHRHQDIADIGYSITFLMNWARAFRWVAMRGDWLGHTWSLAIEEQFYIIWPVSLILLSRYRKTAPLIIIALILIVSAWRLHLALNGAYTERTYDGFDTHSDSLLLGCLIAFLPFDLTKLQAIAADSVLIPICGFAVILFTVRFDIDSTRSQTTGISLAAIGSAWLLLAASAPGLLNKCLSLPPMVYTGRISYAWYLWDYPLIRIAKAHMSSYLLDHGGMIIAIIASFIAAALSYHFVEQPFLRLKHRFETRKFAERPVSNFESPKFQT